MPELHVNVDHVATLRQVRKTVEPTPLQALKILETTKVAGVTTHLREDRRHIIDEDVYEIDEYLRGSKMGLTFEMGATEEIRAICLKTKAKLATLVPERREELTTEGGLDLSSRKDFMAEFIKPIQANGTKISFFLDPVPRQIEIAAELGAEFVELHTGAYANLFLQDDFEATQAEAARLIEAALYAQELGLNVNLGHGLTVDNLPPLLEIPNIKELHIGHSIVANSIYKGIKAAAEDFLALL